MNVDRLVVLHHKFQESATLLSSVGLYKSAKWSAEALNGLPPLDTIQEKQLNELNIANNNISDLEIQEFNKLILARTYFDCKEFDRVANLLKNCKSSKALFIKLYSLYLSSEKRIQEESHEIMGEKQHSFENKNASSILKEIENFFQKSSKNITLSYLEKVNHSLLYYLLGIIYLKRKDYKSAQNNFFKSINLYEFNWECWNDLASSCNTFDEAVMIQNKLKLSDFNNNENLMKKIFLVVIYKEFFQQNTMLYQELEELIEVLPNFLFLKIQKALISYNVLNYSLAETLFDEIIVEDPYNLDFMDVYSNILYVTVNKTKLSFLAQFSNSIDKFRPETCCILANFYSLKFEHEKAIMYYRRALNLNKNWLTAWTLMGHEFIELKNTHAAIESYRRAVDINVKDFRAWCGLGLAYEVLEMHLYSLYYYQKACELKPLDHRMWSSVGNCYEKLGKYKESIQSYKKILTININEEDLTTIYYKLGKLYETIEDLENAEVYMKLCLNDEINSGVVTEQSNKSRLWLANLEMKRKNYKLAYDYASEFHVGSSHEIEEARNIVRECRNY